ncbi:hypothetical protein [Streptomyces halobius]|uniref:Secreted protein n=1 Tax=Streptomyces halobius TaxID=2879846 RepID=A0ABY4M3F6_9ACTN|nr:hypothetical protein [Streptomyces halobius]UQA92299.1 hypothetical protein K9S39_10995 [Streptomyces halobius]
MRAVRTLTSLLLVGGGMFGATGTAVADATSNAPADSPSAGSSESSPSGTPSPSGSAAGPTEAGTSFRTAAKMKLDQRAVADASTGDYLYWVLPLDSGQRATVKAEVKLPEAARHGTATWQLDVYDGLRRRQACRYGAQSRAAAEDAGSVELSCTLRSVRAWAEPWANDPLPGSYYVRLTVVDLPQEDLGLPVHAEVEATAADTGGSQAVDGALSAPLVPGISTGTPRADDKGSDGGSDGGPDGGSDDGSQPDGGGSTERAAAFGEPDGGWSSGWWSGRWIWTAAGGLLGALAGIAGYSFTRGSGRPSRVPPGPDPGA